MGKYGDVRRAGRSRVVPYRPDEHPSERHARRADAADQGEAWLRARCEAAGATLTLHNGRIHWVIQGVRNRAEWWPLTAKLVINQKWEDSIHAHDVEQVARIVFGVRR